MTSVLRVFKKSKPNLRSSPEEGNNGHLHFALSYWNYSHQLPERKKDRFSCSAICEPTVQELATITNRPLGNGRSFGRIGDQAAPGSWSSMNPNGDNGVVR